MRTIFLFFTLTFFIACTSQTEGQTEVKEKVEVREYYPAGVKKIEGQKIDGIREGKWIYYYENGFIWSEGRFKNGERTGYSTVYHENGKKKIEGGYEKGKKVGVWKFWKQDGSLVKSIDFDKSDSTVNKEETTK